MGTGTGYGKTILIGDQFVLEEVPAIVSAIAYETEAVVERRDGKGWDGKGWILEDRRREVPGYKESKKAKQIESIDRILRVMGIDAEKSPLRITFGGSLLAGSGIGASAAGCVALARALNEEFRLELPIEEINRIAWEGEFPYHGIPSGVDNTASCYGGLLFYRIRSGEKIATPIPVREPIPVVLANSGISADTKLLDGLVKDEKEKDPKRFRERMDLITEQSFRMRESLMKHDLADVGRLMIANHEILVAMGLSHERLDYLCRMALKRGASGAKLTGGGMGGYMIALTPEREAQNRVADAMEKEGFPVIRTSVGGT